MDRISRPLLDPESDYDEYVEFAFGNVPSTQPSIVLLPVTRFRSETEATDLWEQAEDQLAAQGIGPPNTWPDVDGKFAELVLNAAQHSLSKLGCTATLECTITDWETVFSVGVADAGVGILSSLRKNIEFAHLRNDESAISSATELGVSGTTERRGVGLHFVAERVSAYRGELLIVSGSGLFVKMKGRLPMLKNLTPASSLRYNGTAVMASLPIPTL